MKKWMYPPYIVVLVSLLMCQDASAQDTSDAWVQEIGAPQYFAVLVAEVDRSVAWYRTVFGLQEIGGSKAEDGSWQIENLSNEQLLVEIIRDDRAQEVERARGFRKVGFQVPDVRAVADRVARATDERPRISEFAEYGIRLIQIQDPDGNTIQLSSPLRSRER